MKNTQSRILKCLHDDIVSTTSVDLVSTSKNIFDYIDELENEADGFVNHEDSWEPSESDIDYIDTLRALAYACQNAEDISSFNLSDEDQEKLKIVFIVQEFSLWASFKSVYSYLTACSDFDVKIVFVHTATNKYVNPSTARQEYRNAGYDLIDMCDYNLQAEAPDMVFYLKPYRNSNGAPAKFAIEEVHRHVRYSVFISYCLDVQGGDELFKYFYAQPMFYHAWKICGYSDNYNTCLNRYSYRDGSNIAHFSHPKFDGIYELANTDVEIEQEWLDIIQDKPVILWNSHFSVKRAVGVGTFFTYKDDILNYFRNNKDKVLLWRPHPYFFCQITADPLYRSENVEEYIEELESMDNVIVDRGGNYHPAFLASDAMVSDATTFMMEYAMTGREVLYTKKLDGESVINDAYLKGVDVCMSADELIEFMDSLVQKREINLDNGSWAADIFGKCDGRNGERFAKYLLNELSADIQKQVDAIIDIGGKN